MKVKIFFSTVFLTIAVCAMSQIYLAKTCEVSFFSKGPIEDIAAVNNSSKPILNIANGEIAVKIIIKGFVFKKKLMEEHFNEKYLESDKYPYSTFTGKINEPVDYTKEDSTKVTVTGKLNIHGVEKEYTIPGTIIIKGKEIIIASKFNVALKDHDITIPKIVTQNIAEIIEVKINSTLTEFKK